MKLIKSIVKFFKKLFGCKSKPKEEDQPIVVEPEPEPIKQYEYELVYEEMAEEIDSNIWTIPKAGQSSWNKHAGLKPKLMENDKDGKFIRLVCEASDKNDDGWMTAAMKTKTSYSDGKFECEARFNSGIATWPAIWMTHPKSGTNYATYYEIDLSEYYNTDDHTVTTYHYPDSMRGTKKFQQTKTNIVRNDWNKFCCEWNEETIRVWINDNLSMELLNNEDANFYPIEFTSRDFTIILSMQYTNKYLPSPDLQELPLWMDVRNFKIYRKL